MGTSWCTYSFLVFCVSLRRCWQFYFYFAAWLTAHNSTPWRVLLVLIHIALHPRLIHQKVPELLRGLLDIDAFLVMLNLLHSDLSWSWWITHLCRDWRTAVNLIVIFTVLLPIQISRTLVRENLKLFSPGHVSWNRSKQASSPFEIYVLPWQQDYVPNGTSIWNLRLWSFATAILKVMLSKFQMIGPSCSFWKSTDLSGVSGSTTTSNPPC